MKYNVFIVRRAQKGLATLQRKDRERVQEAIYALSDEPRPAACRKLSGREYWRIRIGQYRVVYEIDDTKKEVTVLDVGHRRDMYR